jgi:hypothetical protein
VSRVREHATFIFVFVFFIFHAAQRLQCLLREKPIDLLGALPLFVFVLGLVRFRDLAIIRTRFVESTTGFTVATDLAGAFRALCEKEG